MVVNWFQGGPKFDKLASYKIGVMEYTIAMVISGNHLHKKEKTCSTLEVYKKIPIFAPASIIEDVVKLVIDK